MSFVQQNGLIANIRDRMTEIQDALNVIRSSIVPTEVQDAVDVIGHAAQIITNTVALMRNHVEGPGGGGAP